MIFTVKNKNIDDLFRLLGPEGAQIIVRWGEVEFYSPNVSITIPAVVEETGVAVIHSAVLHQIADWPLHDQEELLRFRSVGEELRVDAGHAMYTFPILPDEPKLPAPAPVVTAFAIDNDELRHAVKSVLFVAPEDRDILLESSGTELVVVATDGHRLALSRLAIALPEFRIQIPSYRAEDITALATETEHGISVMIRNNSVGFCTKLGWDADEGEATIFIPRSETPFPAYQKVIPRDQEHCVTVKRKALEVAARTVAVGAGSNCLRMQILHNVITLDADGYAAAVHTVSSTKSPTIGMNARYLIEALGPMHTEEIQLHADGPGDAITIIDGDGTVTHVIMPMAL